METIERTAAMRVKCGNCKKYHESAAAVRDCYEADRQAEWEMKAELEAERRNERWFEERGGYEPEDPREVEAQMMDDLRRAQAIADSVGPVMTELAEEEQAAQVLDQMAGAPGRDMASEKQVKYALDLLATHKWPDVITEADLRNMERRQVSKLIDNLKHAPKLEPNEAEPAVGMYKTQDGDILRVYLGQRSGHNLVKRMVVEAGYRYQYVGSARKVAAGLSDLGKVTLTRMTLEEAKEFGRMTGTCVVCGRRLDVPESVEAGIGPVCAQKDGWS